MLHENEAEAKTY